MPTPTNHIPKYRKHRGSGQAVCTIAGKDFYLSPHGTKASQLQYDRLIASTALYLTCAKQVAAVASNATKLSHPDERAQLSFARLPFSTA